MYSIEMISKTWSSSAQVSSLWQLKVHDQRLFPSISYQSPFCSSQLTSSEAELSFHLRETRNFELQLWPKDDLKDTEDCCYLAFISVRMFYCGYSMNEDSFLVSISYFLFLDHSLVQPTNSEHFQSLSWSTFQPLSTLPTKPIQTSIITPTENCIHQPFLFSPHSHTSPITADKFN
jgi:hypothetical protein